MQLFRCQSIAGLFLLQRTDSARRAVLISAPVRAAAFFLPSHLPKAC
jgi:hypothetical protein